MKSTHFPLLRSSPAVGTGSYGALPNLSASEGSSYPPSSLSVSAAEDEHEDNRDSDREDNNGPAPSIVRKRAKQKGKAGTGVHVLDDSQSKVGETEGFEGERAPSIENDEDDEDDEDPVDNSP